MTDNFDTIGNLPTIQGDDGTESKLLADRYKIIRKLGEGGMGLVYLAEDTELSNNKVAIKFIPPQLAGNARAIKNLKKEAQTAMQLSHPNIVRLHDLHTDGHQKFLVMEYIEGKTLDDLLAEKEEGKFTLEELLPIAEQVAAGLDYAHGKKVLHRDLKPSNIMIDKNGTVKLLDFGIAREMKDSYTRVTGNETSGTLPYMSPEQLMGKNPTVAMDIYSFAAVIYECLSSHPPFYRGDIREQIRLRHVDPIRNIPQAINESLLAALSKTNSERPVVAKDLIAGLNGNAVSVEKAVVPSGPVVKENIAGIVEKKKCPSCQKEIQVDWKMCPFCRASLTTEICSNCGKEMQTDWKKCPYCLSNRKEPELSEVGPQNRNNNSECPQKDSVNKKFTKPSARVTPLSYITGKPLDSE